MKWILPPTQTHETISHFVGGISDTMFQSLKTNMKLKFSSSKFEYHDQDWISLILNIWNYSETELFKSQFQDHIWHSILLITTKSDKPRDQDHGFCWEQVWIIWHLFSLLPWPSYIRPAMLGVVVRYINTCRDIWIIYVSNNDATLSMIYL